MDDGYKGLAYYWGPGNGCGYCGGGDVQSSVRLGQDTFAGSVSFTEDDAASRSTSSAERCGVWDQAEAAGDVDGFVAFLGSTHPKEVHVTDGFVRSGHALLLVAGEGAYGKVEVSMALEDGTWRFEEETLSPARE